MKYNIGDLVRLDNNWEEQVGLIIDIIEHEQFPVYYIIIPSEESPGWISEHAIVSKV